MRYKRDLIFGLCVEALRRGVRGGFPELVEASIAAYRAAKMPSNVLRSIPVQPIEKWLGSRRPEIRLTVQAYEDGMLPYHEAFVLLSILVMTDPKVVLEIGTFNGNTSKAMAMNLPNAIIHTVDLPPDFDPSAPAGPMPKDDFHLIARRKVGREYIGTAYASRIVQHFGDTATWKFNEAQGATFFFIDGAHTYEYCKSDSEKCLELSGSRGTFLWHDCNDDHPGVLQLIAEWRSLGRNIIRFESTALCYWSSL